MNMIDPIGLQLYTIRTEMERDFEGALERVAAIGYKEVEFAGYFKRTPKEISSLLKRCELTAPSAHIAYQSLESSWPEVLEVAQILGHNYLVVPMIDSDLAETLDGWKRAADLFNRAGEVSKRAGIQLVYHNHFFEFIPLEGELPYNILLEACDPDLLKMEMDFCWIAAVGHGPLPYFQRYPGRFPLVHLKQLKSLPTRRPDEGAHEFFEQTIPEITEVDDGVIDWESTLSQSTQAGIEHYFVEQDAPDSPFDSIRKSCDYVYRLRF